MKKENKITLMLLVASIEGKVKQIQSEMKEVKNILEKK